MTALTAHTDPQHIIKKGERLFPWLLCYRDLVHQNKVAQGPRTCMGRWEQPPPSPALTLGEPSNDRHLWRQKVGEWVGLWNGMRDSIGQRSCRLVKQLGRGLAA